MELTESALADLEGLHKAELFAHQMDIDAHIAANELFREGARQWMPALIAAARERDRFRGVLLSRHGGECLSLLSELDAARAEAAGLRARLDGLITSVDAILSMSANLPDQGGSHGALRAAIAAAKEAT